MKMLYITSLSGKRINGFMRSAIVAAHRAEVEFVMACNTNMSDTEGYKKDCIDYNIKVIHVDFDRNPLSHKNIKAYRQLNKIMHDDKYDIVHCNTPIGGVLGRICAKKVGINNIIYMAHGFHFWKGAPLVNWMLYYPIEKILSKYSDIIITITKEDYEFAKKHFKTQIKYVHGVGVNLEDFSGKKSKCNNLRQAIGIPDNATVILSVGELNKNKNHKIVMDAINICKHEICYVICGEGELYNEYQEYIKEHGMNQKVFLVGFRHDVKDFYKMADIFVFPSLREGIPGAIMEAIASGIPVIASDIRGVRDIIQDSWYRFSPKNTKQLAQLIDNVIDRDNTINCRNNIQNIKPYLFDSVVNELKEIYENMATN